MAVVKIAIKEGYFQPMTFLKMLSLVWLTMSDEVLRDEPLENLWGGGERSTKKYSRKGKLNEKNSCTPINLKKIFMLWPKKNSHKEFDNKKFLRLENSPPPPPP